MRPSFLSSWNIEKTRKNKQPTIEHRLFRKLITPIGAVAKQFFISVSYLVFWRQRREQFIVLILINIGEIY